MKGGEREEVYRKTKATNVFLPELVETKAELKGLLDGLITLHSG